MPIYEYKCSNCGYILEELQSISEPPLNFCPQCSHNTLNRLIGGGAGLIFKGSGFYLTDYKKSGNSSAEPGTSEKTKGKPEVKKENKEGTKSDTTKSKADKKSN